MPRTAQQYADELLADSLAAGQTVVKAARTAGVSERTAYRRMKTPAVRARIAEVRRAALDAVAGRLTQGMASACDHLTELIGHDNPHVQIRAAKTVLQLALQVRRAVDVEDRLDQLGDQPRLPPVGPAVAAVGPRPVALGSGRGPVDRSDSLPEQPGSNGKVDSSTEDEMRPGAHTSATGSGHERNVSGESNGEELTPPVQSPVSDSSVQATRVLSRDPGTGREADRFDRSASRGVVVWGLLLAAGFSFAVMGTACAQSEPGTDHRAQTCQNLPEPATQLDFTREREGLGERPAENAPHDEGGILPSEGRPTAGGYALFPGQYADQDRAHRVRSRKTSGKAPLLLCPPRPPEIFSCPTPKNGFVDVVGGRDGKWFMVATR